MDRRNFLKSFSAAVAGTIIAVKLPLATPITERVVAAKEHYSLLTEVYEIKLDCFTVLRLPKFQFLLRQKSFEDKGYTLNGNQLTYSPKWSWYDEEWDSV